MDGPRPGPTRRARALWLGRRRYDPIHALQKRLVETRAKGGSGDVVLFVEHEPVVTFGRSADRKNLLASPEMLRERGVDVVETGRGGDVTFHGPGQLVAYPILDLKPDRCDVRKYVRGLADVMIHIARDNHVEAGVIDGKIGLWVDAAAPSEWAGEAWAADLKKVGAIGVRISRWVTMHGFALNLDVDLSSFGLIVPCGIRELGVTSLAALTGRAPSVRNAAFASGPAFAAGLDVGFEGLEDLSEVDLDAALPP